MLLWRVNDEVDGSQWTCLLAEVPVQVQDEQFLATTGTLFGGSKGRVRLSPCRERFLRTIIARSPYFVQLSCLNCQFAVAKLRGFSQGIAVGVSE